MTCQDADGNRRRMLTLEKVSLVQTEINRDEKIDRHADRQYVLKRMIIEPSRRVPSGNTSSLV